MADDFVGPAFTQPGTIPKSPFQNLSAGSKTAQSVDAFKAGNPALWGNLYSDIQSGQMRIGEYVPVTWNSDESGNVTPGGGGYYTITDAKGNPTQWKATAVPNNPNAFQLTIPHGDYIQNMVVGTDPATGYIAPVTDNSKQVEFHRWNYGGSGLQSMLQNPVAGLMLSALLPGAGSAIGSALGLGEGALASAAGSSLLGGATSSLAGGDFTKGALAGGLGSLAGSALNAGNASPADIAAMADVGMGTNTSLLQSAAQAAGQAAAQPTGIEALTEATATPVPNQTALTPTPIPEPAGIQTLPASPSDYLAADAAQTQTNLQDPFAYTEPGAVETIPSTPSKPTTDTDYSDYGSPTGPGAPGTSMASIPTGEGTAELVDVTGTAPAATSPGWLQQLSDATGLPIGLLQGAAGALGIKALGSLLPDQQPGTPQQGSQTPVGVGLSSSYTPYTYKPYAQGGIASLGGYSDGGQLLRGPGDGVSDSIPATIANRQPARLADGEFVIPARIVSELGNGSTDAGARQLYAMMDRIQSTRRKSIGKGKVAVDSRASKQLPA